MSRLRLLAYMYGNGELSQADIQRHLEVDGATVTRQVKQLQAEGLLQRRVDPKDNRFTLVTLTEAGQGMVETLIGRGQEFQQLAIQNIEPEQPRGCGRSARANALQSAGARGRKPLPRSTRRRKAPDKR